MNCFLFFKKFVFGCSAAILAKVAGLVWAIWYFDLEWQIDFVNNQWQGIYVVVFERDVELVSSFAFLSAVVTVMFFGAVAAFRCGYALFGYEFAKETPVVGWFLDTSKQYVLWDTLVWVLVLGIVLLSG